MKAILLSPFTPISKNIASHRAAQAIIYADQLKYLDLDIDVSMTGDIKDVNQYDIMYVYHGNDWGGTLNLFGGMKNYANIKNFVNFSQFRGKVFSLGIEFPDYHEMLTSRMRLLREKEKLSDINPEWHGVNWDNLLLIQKGLWYNTNRIGLNRGVRRIAAGDSHAICMYRPDWLVNSVPFKTLHGALQMGLKEFLFKDYEFKEIEFYFGNIDVRHHLCRQTNPEQATRELVQQYFDQAREFNTKIMIYEPLPIENESRSVPKTGWYKGTPFYGSWEDRNRVRNIFIDECKKQQSDNVTLFEWTKGLINEKGELDFKYMEQPKSIHLSREYYPHWQGREYNQKQTATTNLEDFFND